MLFLIEKPKLVERGRRTSPRRGQSLRRLRTRLRQRRHEVKPKAYTVEEIEGMPKEIVEDTEKGMALVYEQRAADGSITGNLGFGETGRRVKQNRTERIRAEMQAHEKVQREDLKAGDYVYEKLSFPSRKTSGANNERGYVTAYYMYKVVEESGRLWFEFLTETPLHPTSHGRIGNAGTRVPVSAGETYYRIRQKETN